MQGLPEGQVDGRFPGLVVLSAANLYLSHRINGSRETGADRVIAGGGSQGPPREESPGSVGQGGG